MGMGSMGSMPPMPPMPPPTLGGGTGMASPMSAGAAPPPAYGGALSYESVAAQTPDFNSTVYVGNLIPYTTQADLMPVFQGYGYIVEMRMQADRGFAFVKLDSHQNAALAITNLQNTLVHGRPIRCSWGKDSKPGEGGTPTSGSQSPYAMVRQFLFR